MVAVIDCTCNRHTSGMLLLIHDIFISLVIIIIISCQYFLPKIYTGRVNWLLNQHPQENKRWKWQSHRFSIKPSLHEVPPLSADKCPPLVPLWCILWTHGYNQDCHVDLLLAMSCETISCVQGTDDSVRSCFIKFALSFLVIGGDHVIRAILELKGM